MSTSNPTPASNKRQGTWKQWAIPALVVLIALVVGLLFGGLFADHQLKNYDSRLPWVKVGDAGVPGTPAAVTSGGQESEADSKADDATESKITVFQTDGSETLLVQIPSSSTGVTAQAPPNEPSSAAAEAVSGRTSNNWVQALIWVLLFGISAFLAYLIYAHLRKSAVEYQATTHFLVEHGYTVEADAVSVSGVTLHPEGDGKEDDTPVVPAPPKPKLTLTGPFVAEYQKPSTDFEYRYELTGADVGELDWGVSGQSNDAFTLDPNFGTGKIKVTATGTGTFTIWARLLGDLEHIWMFAVAVIEAPVSPPASAGKPTMRVPFVGVGWGTMLLGLFLLLLTTILALEGVIESSVVSGVFLGVAGFLFGASAVGNNPGAGDAPPNPAEPPKPNA